MTLDQLSAAAAEGEYDRQVQLWFFRELTSYQRLALFNLCGLPVDEIGHNQSHQRLCLKRVLRRTGQLVAVEEDAIERVARAICDASGEAWRSGEGLRYPFSHNAEQLNNHWLYKAKAAIAAMKDTQP